MPRPAACVQDLAAQAERDPDATALVFSDRRVTYGALNAEADRLASHLRRLGVGPETLVGLCLRRSPALLAGIFGTLKAGGAYVPLDPGYPAARLEALLADARVSVLVSEEESLPGTLPAGVRTVLLDRDRDAIDRERDAPAPEPTSPERAAYVIYTSGSTGLPKGVVALQEASPTSPGRSWRRSASARGSACSSLFPVQSAVALELVLDRAAQPTRYEYDWTGNGTFTESSSTPVPLHVYDQPGNYRPRNAAAAPRRTVDCYGTSRSLELAQAVLALMRRPR